MFVLVTTSYNETIIGLFDGITREQVEKAKEDVDKAQEEALFASDYTTAEKLLEVDNPEWLYMTSEEILAALMVKRGAKKVDFEHVSL
jgi:hypothetical protein